MKTVAIIAGVLAVMSVVYSFDEAKFHRFLENVQKCSAEFGGSINAPSAEAIACVLEKDRRFVNANGELNKESILAALADGISDAAKLEKAREIYSKCHDEGVKSGATGREQILKISSCSLPGLALFDKPQ